MIFGQCDCCGKSNRMLGRATVTGIETFACAECHYSSPSDWDEASEIEAEIERLRPKAETGEQWAHLCALEDRRVELTSSQ